MSLYKVSTDSWSEIYYVIANSFDEAAEKALKVKHEALVENIFDKDGSLNAEFTKEKVKTIIKQIELLADKVII